MKSNRYHTDIIDGMRFHIKALTVLSAVLFLMNMLFFIRL